MNTIVAQLKAQGYCGWYVLLAKPILGHGQKQEDLRAHKPSGCQITDQDPKSYHPTPVEEVPAAVKRCEHCGDVAPLRNYRLGLRPR